MLYPILSQNTPEPSAEIWKGTEVLSGEVNCKKLGVLNMSEWKQFLQRQNYYWIQLKGLIFQTDFFNTINILSVYIHRKQKQYDKEREMLAIIP